MVQRIQFTRNHRVVMLLCIGGHLGFGSAFGHEIKDVLHAWESRSEEVGSWRVLFEGDYTFRPSNNPALFALNPLKIGPDELPQEEIPSPAEWESWLSGRKDPRVLFRRNAVKSVGETGALWRVNSRVAYDGKQISKVERWDGIKLNLARIYDKKTKARALRLKDVEVKPIVMCFRALDEKAGGFRQADLKMSDRTGTLGKRNLLIIEGRYDAEIWVDPDRAFSVAKYSTPRIEMEIDYIRHATGVWIPSGWTIAANSYYKVRVATWDINPELTDADFAISFPPETLIRDLRARPFRSSYVDERGNQRNLNQEEADQLFGSSMGRVFPSIERPVSTNSKENATP